MRVFWDRLREPSFVSKWNPFAIDFPYVTFTHHPVRTINDTFAALCDIHKFSEQLKDAAEKAHIKKPVPGKANGVLALKQPIYIEAYVGAMAFLGNQNKLGYCMARGNVGF
ncbi:transcript variant X2 [Nothobranchius furzeri]|uniref:Transcript variant X1 n=5 Tax=Nothobranchius TaxID=28779 RepID=A0A9D3BFG9_NOTFU|nr:tumor protein p63-regulated gene 1-like protein [Nothobranchius furzeri]KAF7205133.1 transcript variant X1 [Nothobranchius furzeri]KAF7205134.1 transcript variant X2 [Nothobranchius furzeri]